MLGSIGGGKDCQSWISFISLDTATAGRGPGRRAGGAGDAGEERTGGAGGRQPPAGRSLGEQPPSGEEARRQRPLAAVPVVGPLARSCPAAARPPSIS